MNKTVRICIAALLLICLSLSLMACGNEPKRNERPLVTNQPDSTDDIGGNEATTDQESGGEATQPTVDYGTDVGSGRIEGTHDETKPTQPPETKPENNEGSIENGLNMNYQQYMALSGKQQQELYDKYFSDDPLAFAEWFKKIKQEYDDETPEIIATGPIDIGDYINP